MLFDVWLTEPVQIGLVIFPRKKARCAIVASLHDMQRDAINVNAGAAWHGGNLV